ncbi:MAG: hypothetical protein ACXVPQ_05715 [Bacteroidia bacterium]
MGKHILVLAYKFPPYEGIGARRWAKFPKYLIRNGHTVHVITNKWKSGGKGSWNKDVTTGNGLKIVRLQTPFNFFRGGMAITDKIVNKAEHLIGKLLTWTDEAYSFYVFNFRKISSYISANNIPVVIATGGPFSSNYFASLLKKKHPHLKVIQDFRDLWTEEEPYFFEFQTRSPTHPVYLKELAMEAYSLRHSDHVVSVTPGCISRFQKKAEGYGIRHGSYSLIENGYDTEDRKTFAATEYPSVFRKSELNVAYFGTAGFGREDEFLRFLLSVQEQMTASAGIRFHFFGSFGEAAKQKLKASPLSAFVSFHPHLPPETIQLYMYFADVHLLINDPISYFAYGSKTFDAFMYRKPVFLISRRDALYDLIVQNNLGLATDNSGQQNKRSTGSLIANAEAIRRNDYFNRSFDFDRFSLETLAGSYSKIINSL